jgi:ferredoxin-fold anticodon binding domain-containing protein
MSEGLTHADAFRHREYPDVTVTTTRSEGGKIAFAVRGKNKAHVRAVESEMLAIVNGTGAKVGNRTERTE